MGMGNDSCPYCLILMVANGLKRHNPAGESKESWFSSSHWVVLKNLVDGKLDVKTGLWAGEGKGI